MTRLLQVVLTTQGSAAADAAATLLSTSTGGLLTVGTVAALLLLLRALRSVLHGLSVISGRPPRTWRAALVLAVVLLVGAATVTATAVQDPLLVLAVPGGSLLWSVLRWPAVALALLGWAALLLRVGLRVGRRRARPVLVGAVVAAIGWFAASAVFPIYVSAAARVTASFGALGGGLILLVWLYLLMLTLFLAAEFVHDADAPARDATET